MDLSDTLLAMTALFFWLMCISIFIYVFADMLRRHDLSGAAKAGWAVLIVVLPLVGSLVYIIVRPRLTDEDRERAMAPYDAGRDTSYLDVPGRVPETRQP